MRNGLAGVASGFLGALIIWALMQSLGPGHEVIVLHRAGNPPSIYIAKFDALGSAATNMISCEEFRGFVEKLSPETGPVRCSSLK